MKRGGQLKRKKPLRRFGLRRIRELVAERRFRALVLERDGYRCQRCRRDRCAALDAHHLLPRGRGGSHHISNGVTLCRACHDGVHGIYGGRVADWKDWMR